MHPANDENAVVRSHSIATVAVSEHNGTEADDTDATPSDTGAAANGTLAAPDDSADDSESDETLPGMFVIPAGLFLLLFRHL